jgi:hypothetical protein
MKSVEALRGAQGQHLVLCDFGPSRELSENIQLFQVRQIDKRFTGRQGTNPERALMLRISKQFANTSSDGPTQQISGPDRPARGVALCQSAP